MKPARVHTSNILTEFFKDKDPLESKKTQLKMIIAVRIDDALKNKRIRKKELASLMDRNGSEITKWLSGNHNFTIETLAEIEYYLGVDLLNPQIKYCTPCIFKITRD